jgi:hypothetical protein
MIMTPCSGSRVEALLSSRAVICPHLPPARPKRILIALIGLAVLFALIHPSPLLAVPNAGGVLLLHADPSITYSSGINYCGMTSVPACSSVVTQVSLPRQTPLLVYAMAAIPDSSDVRLAGITFGINYDASKLHIIARGKCADGREDADPTWPAPGTGTSLTWSLTELSHLSDVYWFAVDVLSQTPSSLTLIPHPLHGGGFGDDAVPSHLEPIGDYGVLGFGQAGYMPTCSSTGGLQDLGEYPSPSEPPAPMALGNAEETIRIAEGNDFSVKIGEYERTYSPGDSFHLSVRDGVAYLDSRQYRPLPPHEKVFDMAYLRRHYADVPAVRAYVQSHTGDSTGVWNQAARLYGVAVDGFVSRLQRAFMKDVHDGRSVTDAASRVGDLARASELVDSVTVSTLRDSPFLTLRLAGGHTDWNLLLSRTVGRPPNRLLTETTTRELIAELRSLEKEHPGRDLHVQDRDGVVRRTSEPR